MLNWPGSVPGSPHDISSLPSGRIFVDARIAVAVGDVDLALRRQRGVGAAMERLAAHVRRRLAGMPMVSSTLPSVVHLRTVWSPSSVQ